MSDDPTNLDYEAHADTRNRGRPVRAWHIIKWAVVVCVLGFLTLKLSGF